ncbi:MAG: hypothetical protein ACYC3N_00085 [Halothiobacillus sp.]|jgi:hypothetical protein
MSSLEQPTSSETAEIESGNALVLEYDHDVKKFHEALPSEFLGQVSGLMEAPAYVECVIVSMVQDTGGWFGDGLVLVADTYVGGDLYGEKRYFKRDVSGNWKAVQRVSEHEFVPLQTRYHALELGYYLSPEKQLEWEVEAQLMHEAWLERAKEEPLEEEERFPNPYREFIGADD